MYMFVVRDNLFNCFGTMIHNVEVVLPERKNLSYFNKYDLYILD